MGFKIRTFEEITADMIAFAKGTTDKLTDFHIGSKVRTIFEAVAIVLEQYYHRTWNALKITIEDNVYKAFSFDREQPRSAQGQVKFYRTTSPAGQDYVIPAGTRVRAGTLLFETTEQTTLVKGQTEVLAPIRAVEPGVAGNVPASTITDFVSRPTGIEAVTNPDALTMGKELETRDARKKRFGRYVESLHKGTKPALQYAILQNEDVLEANVVENPVLMVIRDGTDDLTRDCENPFSRVTPPLLTTTVGKSTYFGAESRFSTLIVALGLDGSGFSGVWEYFNGTAWVQIPNVVDGTSGLKTSGSVNFSVPLDWQGELILGQEALWVRFRITSVSSPKAPLINYLFCDPPPGFVDIYVQPAEGNEISEELGEQLTEALKRFRGAGITINLRNPHVHLIEVVCEIRVRREHPPEVVAEQVKNTIHGHFSTFRLGQSFRLNDLMFALRNVEGILDVFIVDQQSTIFAGQGDILRTAPELITVTVVA